MRVILRAENYQNNVAIALKTVAFPILLLTVIVACKQSVPVTESYVSRITIEDIAQNASYYISYDRSIQDSSGDDGTYATGDDDVLTYSKSYVVSDDSGIDINRSIDFSGSGVDEIWFTADDKVASYTDRFRVDEEEFEYYFTGAGSDGVWFTNDDRYSVSFHSTPDQTIRFFYNSAVLDETLALENNSIEHYSVVQHQEGGFMSTRYTGAGQDRRWLTDDDEACCYISYQYTYADEGFEESRSIYHDSGEDLLPFTEDDIINHITGFKKSVAIENLEQNRQLYNSYYIKGPGEDGVWETPDDEYEYNYIHQRLVVEERDWSYRRINYEHLVDDGELSEEDKPEAYTDYINTYIDTKYTIREEINFTSPGVDEIWFTEDDVASFYKETREFEKTEDYVITQRIIYSEPGDDGVWSTEDDVFESNDIDTNISIKAYNWFSQEQ